MCWRGLLKLLVMILALSPALSCEQREGVRGMPLEAASRRVVHLRTITQLLPNRPTHVAVDRIGQIFWVQESENEQDVLFMIGDGGIPRATRLTSSNILEALQDAGDSGGRGRGTGHIRALVAAEGGVYFYFYGFRGNTPKACLGQYLPHSGRIRVLSDTPAMEKLSGMGRSLELARSSLVASADIVYLWLRHSDTSTFLAFDSRGIAPMGPIEPRVPFSSVLADGRPLPLTRIEGELSAAPEGGLFLLDLTSALLWEIDRIGEASARLSLIGLPRQLSPAAAVPEGRVLFFAGDSAKVGTEIEIFARRDLPQTDYPALLEVTRNQITAIGREDFRAHAGFPVYTVRFGRLVPESPGSYLSYDASSGALMRVRIVEQD
jgi:hypothetical protein